MRLAANLFWLVLLALISSGLIRCYLERRVEEEYEQGMRLSTKPSWTPQEEADYDRMLAERERRKAATRPSATQPAP